MFSENGERTKTIDLIRWCIDKEQYQQALTLLESKVPIDIVHDEILYYGDPEKLCCLVGYFANNTDNVIPYHLICEEKIGVRKRKSVKTEDADNEYLFIKYFFNRDLLNNENILKFFLPQDADPLNSGESKRETGEKENRVVELLKKYFKMTKERNDVNHASSGKAEVAIRKEKLENDLYSFIELYENCLKGEVKLDYSEIELIDLEDEIEWESLKKVKKEIKDTKCALDQIRQLSKDEIDESFEESMRKIWPDNQKAIDDFKKVWKAVLWLKKTNDLTYDQICHGTDENCIVLNRMIDFAYESYCGADTEEEFCNEEVLHSKKKKPIKALINKVSHTLDEKNNSLGSPSLEGINI